MWRNLICAAALSCAASGALADVDREKADALFNALLLPQITDLMSREGIEFGLSLAPNMTGGAASDTWRQAVEAIHDPEWMQAEARSEWYVALEGVDIDPILAFATGEPAHSLLQMEVSAREAMLDDDLRETAIEFAAVEMARETPRATLIAQLMAANDLLEGNVASGLNANLAFYNGMAESEGDMPTDAVLAEVLGRADDMRASTAEWLYAFLLLAYTPASDADIEGMITFAGTPAGKTLSRVSGVAFDPMIEQISHNLGRAAARLLVSEEL
ncbi:hypothetical protein BVG79_01563 [Ketogulonicigenium robustum]|uniref:DUF2059 domain-containing protein n=1 Tax=Ketogulonicigenium robustum TaxID=92947 RepID=A0A1W6P0V2_9RHOB|nr:hypothetical protein [Ketogulonicigenium robustum]ARO14907.1 hypothetical protein BVG79_01563 [Ketogulonicigenium robustum]